MFQYKLINNYAIFLLNNSLALVLLNMKLKLSVYITIYINIDYMIEIRRVLLIYSLNTSSVYLFHHPRTYLGLIVIN